MKVVHCRKDAYDIYIGRPSKWGNPFSHLDIHGKTKCVTREEAIAKYEEYVRSSPDLMDSLGELEGKILGCWCKPKACHGDILLKLLNERILFYE